MRDLLSKKLAQASSLLAKFFFRKPGPTRSCSPAQVSQPDSLARTSQGPGSRQLLAQLAGPASRSSMDSLEAAARYQPMQHAQAGSQLLEVTQGSWPKTAGRAILVFRAAVSRARASCKRAFNGQKKCQLFGLIIFFH